MAGRPARLAVFEPGEPGLTRVPADQFSQHREASAAAGRETAVCELCRRPAGRPTKHHLVPRARGGNHGPKALLCPTCHRQLHALFTETTLARQLYSIDLLRSDPQVRGYLRWIRKQKDTANFRVRRATVRQ